MTRSGTLRSRPWAIASSAALLFTIALAMVLLQLAWSWQLLILGCIGISAALFCRVRNNLTHGPITTVQFVACPHCGTRNPRHGQRLYECYNCERSFSELSGRYPTLPEHVAGISSK